MILESSTKAFIFWLDRIFKITFISFVYYWFIKTSPQTQRTNLAMTKTASLTCAANNFYLIAISYENKTACTKVPYETSRKLFSNEHKKLILAHRSRA